MEFKALLNQPRGDASSSEQGEFGVGAEEPGTQAGERGGDGWGPGAVGGGAELAHELIVGDGGWGGDDVGALHRGVLQGAEEDGLKVGFVNPAHVLLAGAHAAAEEAAGDAGERGECAASSADDEAGTENDASAIG